MSPYQLDLEKDAGLAKLKELFMAELIYSAKSSRPVVAPQQNDSCDVDSDDQ